jgi:DNA-binding NtrC family response regulator
MGKSLSGGEAVMEPYKNAKAEAVAAFTHSYVNELLAQTKGNVSEAARVSGLSRVALQKILSRMGENAARFRD